MTFNLDGNGPTPWTAELRHEQQSSVVESQPPEDTLESLMDRAKKIVELGGGSILATYEDLLLRGDNDDFQAA